MKNDGNLIAQIYDLESKISSFKVEVNSINVLLNELKSQFERFRSNEFVSASQLSDVLSCFTKDVEKVKDLINTLTQKHAQLNGYYCSLSQELSQNFKKLEDHEDKFEKSDGTMIDLKQNLTSLVNISDSNLRGLHKDLKAELFAKIEAVKQEFISSPKSVVESNQEVSKKVELAHLDSQNAMLKLGNLETQFRIFDRKLENLDIRIKKMELANQQ